MAAKKPPSKAQHHFHLVNFYLTALPDKATTALGKAVGHYPGNKPGFFSGLFQVRLLKNAGFYLFFNYSLLH